MDAYLGKCFLKPPLPPPSAIVEVTAGNLVPVPCLVIYQPPHYSYCRGEFRNVTEKYKEEYQNKISSAESEKLMIQAADEYLKRIEEDMDLAISESSMMSDFSLP